MLSQYYTKPENRINFVINNPNNGIKCTICQLIFPVQQIDRHMVTHIAPHYNTPNTTNNKLKKMSRPRLFLEEKQNQFMQTAFTVKRDDMPRNQSLRKLQFVQSNLTNFPSNQVQHKVSYQNEPSNRNQTDIEATFQIHDVEKQFLEREQIQQDMILDRQNVQFQKSTLQVYAVQNTKRSRKSQFNSTESNFRDFRKISSKMRQNSKFEDSTNQTQTQAYQISQKRKSKFEDFLQVFSCVPEQKREVKIQKSKPPEVRSQSISTKSNKKLQLKKSPSIQFLASIFGCVQTPKDLKKGEITMNMENTAATRQFWRTEKVSSKKSQQNQCHECGGFYCTTCHSTIPPQYRPKNMSSSRNSQIAQFYNKLYYESKKCQDCNQSNSQSILK